MFTENVVVPSIFALYLKVLIAWQAECIYGFRPNTTRDTSHNLTLLPYRAGQAEGERHPDKLKENVGD
jgi:hypothetical protein